MLASVLQLSMFCLLTLVFDIFFLYLIESHRVSTAPLVPRVFSQKLVYSVIRSPRSINNHHNQCHTGQVHRHPELSLLCASILINPYACKLGTSTSPSAPVPLFQGWQGSIMFVFSSGDLITKHVWVLND